MNNARFALSLLAALLAHAILLQHQTVLAEILYSENFDIGNDSLNTWTRRGSGSVDASSGDLVLSGTTWSAAVVSDVPEVAGLSKTSVRAQVAFQGNSRAGIALVSNGDPDQNTAYQGGIVSETGELYLGWNSPPFQEFARIDTDIDLIAGEEVNLQFDVIENQLEIRAWRIGEPKPELPQLTYVDETVVLEPGFPGVLFDPQGVESSGIYRLVQVAVPEPSGALLLLSGLVLMQAVRRRQPGSIRGK